MDPPNADAGHSDAPLSGAGFRLFLPFPAAIQMVKITTGFTVSTVVLEDDTTYFRFGNGRKEPCNVTKRIYVGGLPYSATDEDLENLFASSGTVTSASVVTDRYTGQAKGFGFVEMS